MDIKKVLTYTGVIIFTVTLVFTIGTFYSIYSTVSATCNEAKSTHQKDCVDSMLIILESDEYSISEKNNAIWVLGQLADQRALDKLQSMYTKVPENKEPLDEVISQYEIQKAIKWIENGNSTSFMYKKFK